MSAAPARFIGACRAAGLRSVRIDHLSARQFEWSADEDEYETADRIARDLQRAARDFRRDLANEIRRERRKAEQARQRAERKAQQARGGDWWDALWGGKIS